MLSMLSWSKDPSWRREEKEGKRHRRMNRRYHRCIASEHLVHCATTGVNLIPSDEPMVPFLVASDELEKRSREDSSVGWTDGPLEGAVGLSVVKFEQDRDAPRRILKHWMNRRVCSCSSDSRVEATREVFVEGISAPDDPTVRQSIASEQLGQRSCAVEATASSTGWTNARKSLASDHPTVLLSTAFSQRLVWFLGLFIPCPLAHFRLLDCVEVQESARHLEDHI
jgi:hypothetical protein